MQKMEMYEASVRIYASDVMKYARWAGISLDEDQAQVILGRLGPQLYEVSAKAIKEFIQLKIIGENTLGKENSGTTASDNGNSPAAGGHVSEETDLPRPAKEQVVLEDLVEEAVDKHVPSSAIRPVAFLESELVCIELAIVDAFSKEGRAVQHINVSFNEQIQTLFVTLDSDCRTISWKRIYQ